jgi:hypothetical protein
MEKNGYSPTILKSFSEMGIARRVYNPRGGIKRMCGEMTVSRAQLVRNQ